MNFEARSVGRAKIDDSKRIVLDHEQLQSVDFSGRKLVQFASTGSKLVACRFDEIRMDSASFGAGRETSEYVDCTFDGSRIQFGPGGYSRFVRCSFRDVDLADWFGFSVELIDCTFSGRLRKAWFNGTVPDDDRAVIGREHNEFRGNDFSAMDLVDVAFRTGVDLSKQRLPTGPEYLYLAEAVAAVQRARAEVVGWADLERRQAAMRLIKSLEAGLEGGQRQLLVRRDTYESLPVEIVDTVWALLGGSRQLG